MKNQILVLVVFVLAAFAGINKSYGQACSPSAITPSAGIEYTYSMTSAPGTNPKYDWYVTKNAGDLTADIIAEGTMFTVNPSNQYHNTTNGLKDIKITWTAAAVVDGGPFYLILRYTEDGPSGSGCTVENMRVTEIKPINSFLLAFQGGMLNAGSYTATAGSNTCAANITAAIVTPGSPSTVTLTYGQNELYFVATASGINGDWYPRIQLPALGSTQVYVSAGWSSDMTGGGTFNSFNPAATGATQDLLSTAPATATVSGSEILIKVVINNVNYQTLADQPIELGLDGFLPPTPIVVTGTGKSKSDITSTTDCTELADFGRKATVTINKRPNPTGTPAFLGLTNP